MSFAKLEHLVFILPLLILFFIYFLRVNRLFMKWVEDHWFYKPSTFHSIKIISFVIGVAFLALALLDLRGPEKRIKGKVNNQKTIILIDSSASMLAEDVRPNRFNKSLLLTKHYVKKAVGQQISLVVFSDNQKRIIPFTDDIDLISARIDRLETLQLGRGGTGLAQAIQESVQYFQNSTGDPIGNILVFTDAEDTELNFDLKVPDTVSLGIIAVGTAKGAPIPLRDRSGSFRGNKKFQGKVVITKLDEKNLNKIGSKVKHFKSWIATSYSLPTEEVIEFFSKTNEVKQSENEVKIRPVLTNYLLLPGVVFLTISFLLGHLRSFSPAILLILITLMNFSWSYAQEKKEAPKKSAITLELEQALLKNELSTAGKKALASSLLQDGFPKQAETLYSEVLSNEKLSRENIVDYTNYATAQIENKKVKEGFDQSQKILKHLEKKGLKNEKIEKALKKNILKAIESSSGGGKGKNKEKSDEQNDQNDDQEQENQDSGGKGQKGKDQDSKDQPSKDEKKKNKKDQDEGDQKKQEKDKNKSSQENNKSVSKKKLPAILKQLIQDDNQLQKKIIDAQTVERKGRERKDW